MKTYIRLQFAREVLSREETQESRENSPHVCSVERIRNSTLKFDKISKCTEASIGKHVASVLVRHKTSSLLKVTKPLAKQLNPVARGFAEPDPASQPARVVFAGGRLHRGAGRAGD